MIKYRYVPFHFRQGEIQPAEWALIFSPKNGGLECHFLTGLVEYLGRNEGPWEEGFPMEAKEKRLHSCICRCKALI